MRKVSPCEPFVVWGRFLFLFAMKMEAKPEREKTEDRVPLPTAKSEVIFNY
jgi:hypothetical protein